MARHQPTSGRVVTLCCVTCEKPFDHTTKLRGRYPRFCSDPCRAAKYRWLTEQKGQRTGSAVLTMSSMLPTVHVEGPEAQVLRHRVRRQVEQSAAEYLAAQALARADCEDMPALWRGLQYPAA